MRDDAELIFLPGLACDAELFAPQLPALPAQWCASVTTVHTRHTTLPAMAAALLAEHAGPLVLCGASMGGMLAFEVLRQAPQRVRGLALLGTSARPDTPELLELRERAIGHFAQGRLREVLEANVMFAFAPRQQRDVAMVRRYLEMIERAGAAQLIAQNRAIMARPDSRPGLAAIACPTLMLCGQDDALTTPVNAQEIAAAIPNVELHLLPECGHMLTWEAPALVNAHLLRWLERL
jgi:pimeloyl-ACP methyl ester carboxylesterase